MSESELFGKINKIYKELKIFAAKLKIISRTELREKIKELLQKFPLSKEEEELLEEKYEQTPFAFIFLGSIKEIPHSISAPSLIEHINYKDITFYFGHTFRIDDNILEHAKQRVYEFKNKKMREILYNFLEKSGYEPAVIMDSVNREILAIKGNSQYVILVYPSILTLHDEIKDLHREENQVFAVPTGNSPGPYLNFYRINANKILLNQEFVWIVDIEDKSVSPFIGNTKDKDLNVNFKSSQLTTYASRIIRMDIDEDF